jgi:hypothetical protein
MLASVLWCLVATSALAGGRTSCRLVDSNGVAVLTHETYGSAARCQSEIREAVKRQRCWAGRRMAFSYVGEGVNGRELRPITMYVTCPRR